MLYQIYRSITSIASPLMPLILTQRLKNGKENRLRINERLGIASQPRPQGKLIWIHGASVGEANSVLPLIDAIIATFPDISILLTTVTVTSAELMAKRLPSSVIHQFIPIDTPEAVEKFIAHWQPNIALFVDSELWANLIFTTRKTGCVMGLVNARMSERSFKRWHLAKSFIKDQLACFDFCFAQSKLDAQRLQALGIGKINGVANLKYDALPLEFSPNELDILQKQIGNRKIWLAASTHSGEEEMIADVHIDLKKQFQDLLTIIVPRHAKRGEEIAGCLADELNIAMRSRSQNISDKIDIYIADTMGELGLFYNLSQIVFIGGSLVKHGGQNPLEAARLNCAIITGKYHRNFANLIEDMQTDSAIEVVDNLEDLKDRVGELLSSPEKISQMQSAAKQHLKKHGGAIEQIIAEIKV